MYRIYVNRFSYMHAWCESSNTVSSLFGSVVYILGVLWGLPALVT